MAIFNQFLLRLAFGLAVGLAITSPRLVSSGYFRNHLYVTLGLATLACLASATAGFTWWASFVAAVVSYVGAVFWLYEKPQAGVVAMWLVAGFSLWGAWMVPISNLPETFTLNQGSAVMLFNVSVVTSGLVLGITTASMLLGHWYLNVPGMQLGPLKRLLIAIALALFLHAVVIGAGLAGLLGGALPMSSTDWMFIVLRWTFGIFGTIGLVYMAWQTLKIPNTQSATGILYVAVIAVFAGELAGLLLSARSGFPL